MFSVWHRKMFCPGGISKRMVVGILLVDSVQNSEKTRGVDAPLLITPILLISCMQVSVVFG